MRDTLPYSPIFRWCPFGKFTLPWLVAVKVDQWCVVGAYEPNFHCLGERGKLILLRHSDVGNFSNFTSG